MATQVRKSCYGNYRSGNYGAHCMRLDVGGLTLWFSYDTVVAFSPPGHGVRVSENCWGPTTGKHLNWIDDGNKARRLPRHDFETLLRNWLAEYNLALD